MPREWLIKWNSSAARLIEQLETLVSFVCVIWKTNNIGHRTERYRNHPSLEGGVGDRLNDITAELATAHGLVLADVRPLTIAESASTHEKAKGIPNFYHDYDHGKLAGFLMERWKERCE